MKTELRNAKVGDEKICAYIQTESIRIYADECEEVLELYKSAESVEELSISEIMKSYNNILKDLMS